MKLRHILTVFLLFFGYAFCGEIRDPYATLNLPRNAEIKEIKRVYKSLVKEWHPDKNPNPKAHEKFMEIQRAYEILNDPLRKERFDKFGTFDDSPSNDQFFDPERHFQEFFNNYGGGFRSANTFFGKHRISMRTYMHTLSEKSFTQPILIFAYSAWCNLCYSLEPIWKSAVEDLEPLGYGIATVNAMTDANLLERMRVSKLPSLLAVVEGRIIHCRESMTSLTNKSVRMFARDVIPGNFLLRIRDYNDLKRFVDQWENTNKISVLIFGSRKDPKTRYMLTAMKYATFARFAYVYLDPSSLKIDEMKEALGIGCNDCEHVFIFNDFPEKGPVASLVAERGQQFTVESLSGLIERNQHLVFPRLASQAHLDELCPVSTRGSRKLCVILAVDSNDVQYISSMRNFVAKETFKTNGEQIQFAYLFLSKQRDFVESFVHSLNKRGLKVDSVREKRDLIVLWRVEYDRARFVWLNGIWDSNDSSVSGTNEKVKKKIEGIIRGFPRMDLYASLGKLVDEYRPSWFTRLARSAVRMGETAWFHLTKEEALPVLSVVGTFLVILLFGYGLSFTTGAEDRRRMNTKDRDTTRVPGKKEDEKWHPDDLPHRNSSTRSSSLRQQRLMREMEPLIHELRAETYFGLVKLLKPGCRSIIVLVDEKSKEVLIPQFARHVWPFRNNKTFSFGYLMIPKNLTWFRKLLEYIMPGDNNSTCSTVSESSGKISETASIKNPRLKNINPSQTLGTVLVLCGWKLYFNIYHPMFSSPARKNFLGFEDDGEPITSEDSDDPELLEEIRRRKRFKPKIEDVLNGLPNWLDRLFEGSIGRYYIPEWPDNLR